MLLFHICLLRSRVEESKDEEEWSAHFITLFIVVSLFAPYVSIMDIYLFLMDSLCETNAFIQCDKLVFNRAAQAQINPFRRSRRFQYSSTLRRSLRMRFTQNHRMSVAHSTASASSQTLLRQKALSILAYVTFASADGDVSFALVLYYSGGCLSVCHAQEMP